MESILTSIKKLLGIEEGYTQFDPDITIYINGVFMALNQLGIGPKFGFIVKGKTQTWVEFLGDRIDIEAAKLYVYLKVRLVFDPPTSSFVLESMKNMATEMEWRLVTQVESLEPVVTTTPL